jgi:plastocyanin
MTFVYRLLAIAGLVMLAALAAAPALGAAVGVGIVDKTFEPAQITVHQGDTVTWTVTKAIAEPHSVTSGALGDPDAGARFDSGIELKDNGQTFEWTFDEPGTFPYFCTVHATEMTGQVIVQAGPGEAHEAVSPERKLIGAGILVATLVVSFAAAWLWRRVNPA